jgi:hypothetical protein
VHRLRNVKALPGKKERNSSYLRWPPNNFAALIFWLIWLGLDLREPSGIHWLEIFNKKRGLSDFSWWDEAAHCETDLLPQSHSTSLISIREGSEAHWLNANFPKKWMVKSSDWSSVTRIY